LVRIGLSEVHSVMDSGKDGGVKGDDTVGGHYEDSFKVLNFSKEDYSVLA
jgi:hypothetical protein